jgi:protein-S-isoprenylcysteine O-methyltransferase Ste14
MRNNKVVAAVLLLTVVAGAALQVSYWNAPREAGVRDIGQFITAVAIVLLAIFAPQYSRTLQSTRYDWRFNVFIGIIIVVAIGVLLWVVYSRYYGPLIQSINSNGGV